MKFFLLFWVFVTGCQFFWSFVVSSPKMDKDDREFKKIIKTNLPGISHYNKNLLTLLEDMAHKKGKQYKPRTRHLTTNGEAKYTNRLFLESNPYLLQHAHNPVNWYAWSEEAFKIALKLNRPILLSIGYSTCHWCHVMEEESFEDEEIAEEINRSYIAIKVDREERPDVDSLYMAAVQAMNGSGGWPMTVWLTPDKKPFYGATYIPARTGDRGARIGFLTLLKSLHKIYREDPDKILKSAGELSHLMVKHFEKKTMGELPKSSRIQDALDIFEKKFDPLNGGLKGKIKFPSSLPNRLFMRGASKYQKMSERTLLKMVSGGIYDHVAGGFHRYSTDSEWLIPHFEKMLYDNALLALTYSEAFQMTRKKEFAEIAQNILNYILRDLSAPDGGFYSATDADSIDPKGESEEGYYYTWTEEEIDKALNKQEADLVKSYYTVTPEGNFERGRTLFNTPTDLHIIAKKKKLSEKDAKKIIEKSREKLYRVRQKRSMPLRDEKILTAWNGLTISALIKSSFIFKENRYRTAAIRATEFILNHLFKENKLYRIYKDKRSKTLGYLNDYAFMTAAFLDLYEVTHRIKWLEKAILFDHILENFFEDKQYGGFFMTGHFHEKLLAREKPSYDGAEPSGNSIHVLNLLRLYEFTTKKYYKIRAEKSFKAFSQILNTQPTSMTEMLLALDFYENQPLEIIIIHPEKQGELGTPFVDILRETFIPHRIISIVKEGEMLKKQSTLIPLLVGKTARDNRTTAYVCKDQICREPTTDPIIFKKQISKHAEDHR